MRCVLCGSEWHAETVPFSAVCEKCNCWLHSCIQCALWNPSSHSCMSFTTDPVSDREGKNFCEEWKPREERDDPEQKRKDSAGKFDSLFR